MGRINNDFAVIDIGTNAVKCIAFINGKQVDTFKNKVLTQSGDSNLNPEEILHHIDEFNAELEGQGISRNNIYIAATEGFRKSSNQREISKKIKEKTGRAIHKISPKREAYLSALGGLSYIKENFKGNPSKVIYIEAGGGSTEVSLIDATSRSLLSIVATVSIPQGSKSKVSPRAISDIMSGFIKETGRKIKKGDEIAVVINSSTASRILSRRYDKEKYNPKTVAEKQYKMRVHNFLKKLSEITGMDKEDIKTQFYLDDERLDGFLNHSYILQTILKKLYQSTKQAQLSATIGGLKHGLVKEIASSKESLAQIIDSEEDILSVNSNGLEIEKQRETLPVHSSTEKEKVLWHAKVKKVVLETNKAAKGKFDFRENTKDIQNGIISFEDKINKNNKLQFSSQNNVSVTGNINAYYAVCEIAKKMGKKIKFGDFNNIENKALLYQACLETGAKMEKAPDPEKLKNCSNFAKIKQLIAKSSAARSKNKYISYPAYDNRLQA